MKGGAVVAEDVFADANAVAVVGADRDGDEKGERWFVVGPLVVGRREGVGAPLEGGGGEDVDMVKLVALGKDDV